jgi:hypothetical protein
MTPYLETSIGSDKMHEDASLTNTLPFVSGIHDTFVP